jgi:hypothetical protein
LPAIVTGSDPCGTVSGLPSRLTVVEDISLSIEGGRPVVFPPTRYGKALLSTEQVYFRHTTVGPEWIPLDHGWLPSCSVLHIVNKEKSYRANPTPEERQRDRNLIVEIGTLYGEDIRPLFFIPPGLPFRSPAANLEALHLRCPTGTASITISVIPE